MRIVVKSGPKGHIRLRFPAGLVLNRFTAGCFARILARKGVHISRSQAIAMVRAANSYRRRHREWVIFAVETAGGEHVEFII